MLLMLADRHFENQQFEAWRRVLDGALAAARTANDPVLLAQATCAWAGYLVEGQNAREALQTIADVQRVVAAPEHADVAALCARVESRAAVRVGDTPRALRAAEHALELESGRRAPANRMLSALASLASALTAAGELARADETYSRLALLTEEQGLQSTLEYAVRLNNWSAMLQSAGQHREAAAISKRAVETARLADSENGASLTMLTTWASALTATGAFRESTDALDEALVKSRAAGSPARHFNTLGQAVIAATEAGDVPRAVRLLEEAEGALAPGAPPLLQGVVAICVALASGNGPHAAEMSRRALASLTAASPSQASLVPTQTFLARSLNASERFGEALEFAEKSVSMARERLGGFRYSSTIGTALLERAIARRGLGETEQARTEAREAVEHLQHTLGPQSRTTQRAERLAQVLESDRR